METININGKEFTKEEFLHTIKYWKVNRLFDNLLNVKPEPPKVRPMSELPELALFGFLAEIERKDNGFKFYECMEKTKVSVQGSHTDFTFFKITNYENEDYKIIGWLYELPNPNKIEL